MACYSGQGTEAGIQTAFILGVVAKALLELAMFLLLAQAVASQIVGSKREQSASYRMFRALARPITRLTRALMPGAIRDRHVPYVAFLLALWAWLLLVLWALPAICGAAALDCGPLTVPGLRSVSA